MVTQHVSDLIDTHTGKSAIVIGSAPTVILAESHVVDLGIFVGDSLLRTYIRPSVRFYVRANTQYPNLNKKPHVADLVNLNATWVFAETVMESEIPVRELLERSGFETQTRYVFDQRHFGGIACVPKQPCCEVLESRRGGEMTLQETLALHTHSSRIYSEGATVSLHAFALAVIMGATEIHIAGVEIPTVSNEYIYAPIVQDLNWRIYRRIYEGFDRLKEILTSIRFSEIWPGLIRRLSRFPKAKVDVETPSVFSPDFDTIMGDFETIVSLAMSVGVKVYVCSHSSNLLRIHGIEKCPEI